MTWRSSNSCRETIRPAPPSPYRAWHLYLLPSHGCGFDLLTAATSSSSKSLSSQNLIQLRGQTVDALQTDASARNKWQLSKEGLRNIFADAIVRNATFIAFISRIPAGSILIGQECTKARCGTLSSAYIFPYCD